MADLTSQLFGGLDRPSLGLGRHLECYATSIGAALLINEVRDIAPAEALCLALDSSVRAHVELLAVVAELARRCGALEEVRGLLQLAQHQRISRREVL